MKKHTILFVMLITAAFFANAQKKNKPVNDIVIVHGSWSSSDDWQAVTSKLKADGNKVTSINLPGHGRDTTATNKISLEGYVDAVINAIGTRQHVVLIGHSFGGIITSAVAERIPDQIEKLVYVAAYVPTSGQSLLTIANTDPDSHVPQYLKIDEKAGIADIDRNGLIDLFLTDAPNEIQKYAEAHFRAEPLAPLAAPVTLTAANFGRVAKIYIHTYADHVNSYTLQQRMVKAAGISQVYALPASHTPFVSMPFILAAIIENESL
ncbi:MAG: alpha/beta fold hydrolase [Chitinophagaceae bacterium]|nr:MAG: alpha/beta fold hydrolase [Chitinophagaceae bacterium]